MSSTETAAELDEPAVRRALGDVPDPEIPVLSVMDLGLVNGVSVEDDGIHVELLPTFVGCPALDAIRAAVSTRLAVFGRPVHVAFSYATPWTSDRITRDGRERLRRAGFAAPGTGGDLIRLDDSVPCPFCGSGRTRLDSLFGPTQCRTVRYCVDCRQPFEAFKDV